MAKSNTERVREALDHFRDGVRRYVIDQMNAKYGDPEGVEKAHDDLLQNLPPKVQPPKGPEEWDASNVISIILSNWQYLFRLRLSKVDQSYLHELRDIRNKAMHQQAFSMADTNRALDTIHRLLTSTSATKEADAVNALISETRRVERSEELRAAKGRAARRATEGTPTSGLRPWREVIQPHTDVCKGEFQNAEFAADLAQVHRGGAGEEYGDPIQFFKRTHLTEGLRDLLINAFKRLNGEGGHPVVELQTNFGGGKTHSMLALYHLCGGTPVTNLAGVDTLMEDSGFDGLPKSVARAVLVGTALSASQPEPTKDGLTLRTLWGRMAYQLGGKEVYDMIAASDENGGSPGSDDLVKVLTKVGPCLILIDELVAYCRDMYEVKHTMPGGSFDSNLKFAQSLTEAVKACPRALLVASLPQSTVEVGGEGGKQALASLESTFGRLEFNWRTATSEESYEIVKRRLFEPIDAKLFGDRDAVVNAYSELYQKDKAEFPQGCNEGSYHRLLENAYPIHPELFVRLYEDWSSLEEFQRTRGVLRLMASVIHTLWVRGDKSLLIMPGVLPVDEPTVSTEFTRYLPGNWPSIIDQDVDGPNSKPALLDKESKRYGQVWAARRAARTIYLGSAPVPGTTNKGIDIRHIRLGCVQPGENLSVFVDALHELSDRTSYLYADGSTYWYSGQPNVNATARDRAAQKAKAAAELEAEITDRLRLAQKESGGFRRVHPAPEATTDVPDDPTAGIVIIEVAKTHANNQDDSPAMAEAKLYYEKRGNSPRQHRNALVFLAADTARAKDLLEAVASHLAWKSILDDKDTLELDPHNTRLAEKKVKETNNTVIARIPETFQWLIYPIQDDPTGPVTWEAVRLTSGGGLAERAFNRLKRDGLITDALAGSILRKNLDDFIWAELNHVGVSQLTDYYANYLYLPRVTRPEVILDAISSGVASLTYMSDGVAYADGFDEDKKRYQGLVVSRQQVVIHPDGRSVVVKPDVAVKQIKEEVPDTPGGGGENKPGGDPDQPGGGGDDEDGGKPQLPKRYFGSINLKPSNASLEFSDVMQEVIQHFTKKQGTRVTIRVEIEAESKDGFDEALQRIVRENGNTMGFDDNEFAED